MYILVLSVIFMVLVIICILTSNNIPIDTSSTFFNPNDYYQYRPFYLSSEKYIDVDIGKQNCNMETSTPNLGFYNLSVIKNKSGFSGVIRASTWNGCCNNNSFPAYSYPYYISLDDNGYIKNLYPFELDYNLFTHCNSFFQGIYANGFEDPKIFLYNNQQWVIGNSLGLSSQSHPCINSMIIFNTSNPKDTLKLLSPPSSVNNFQRQKNWSPFQYNDILLCEYSINPHIILQIDPNTGLTTEFSHSSLDNIHIIDVTNDSSLRGGAPPIIINHNNINYYLAVGHIRTKASSDYFHFFYIFESQPPFRVINISDNFKLDGVEKIQFVSGISLYENHVYISYGVSDCYNRISIYRISQIMELLHM